jgi:hypothetical protein
MNGLEVFEKGYIARLTIPTDPIGATRRQVLEHSARTAVTAVASMLAARALKFPQTYWAPITTMLRRGVNDPGNRCCRTRRTCKDRDTSTKWI